MSVVVPNVCDDRRRRSSRRLRIAGRGAWRTSRVQIRSSARGPRQSGVGSCTSPSASSAIKTSERKRSGSARTVVGGGPRAEGDKKGARDPRRGGAGREATAGGLRAGGWRLAGEEGGGGRRGVPRACAWRTRASEGQSGMESGRGDVNITCGARCPGIVRGAGG